MRFDRIYALLIWRRSLLSAVLLTLSTSAASAAAPVTVKSFSTLAIYPERDIPATVESVNRTDISAQLSAKVEKIVARIGDEVKANDVLVRLDCRDYHSQRAMQRAVLKQLDAQRRLAVNQLKRARKLQNKLNTSQEEVDRREAELSALDAQIAAQKEAISQAEFNVDRCVIRAPYRLTVIERLIGEGALAAPGVALIRAAQLDNPELSAALHPKQMASWRHAQHHQFQYLDESYEVSLRRVVPVVNAGTGLMELRFTFKDENAAPPAGASGRLTWRSVTPHLPADLLVKRRQGLGVFIAKANKASFHVIAAAQEGQPAPVDLSMEDLLVIEGRENLEEGDMLSFEE